MGPRGAGRRLNDQERMEIIDIISREAKVKNVDLAKRYGVSEGAIRKLKQMKDAIRNRYAMGNAQNRDKRKRGGFVRNAKFEQELYEWILRMRETQAYQLIPLTQTAVRQQAMQLAKNYEGMATFKASPGWFARFCSRHQLDPPMQQQQPGVSAGAAAAAAAASAAAAAVNATTDPNAAVGDTIPGGPLASAYQVDTATLPVSFTAQIAAANASAGIVTKVDGSVELSCAEDVAEAAKASLSETTTAAALAVGANATPTQEFVVEEDELPAAKKLKVETTPTSNAPEAEGEAAVAPTTTAASTSEPSSTSTEEEIFSLGL